MPFKLPPYFSWRGIEFQGAYRLLFVFTAFGIIMGSLLYPQVSDLKAV